MKKSSKVFKCSDPSQNVYGFSVNTDGIQLAAFLENPVCLLNHNYDMVMGHWEEIEKIGTTLQGVPVFDTDDTDANKYYGQVERGVMKGASIGIIPISVDGDTITSCDLLEISITPVPANRNSLVIYNAERKKLNAKEARAYMLSIDPTNNEKEDKSQTKIMNKELLAALVLLCANAGVTVELSADAKDEEIKNAIASVNNKVTALTLSNTQLKTANDAFKAAELNAKNAEAATAVDAAIADKRITADKRESFIKLFAADADLAKTTLDSLKPVTLSVVPGAVEQKEVAGRENWTFDDYAKNDSVALSAMQVSEPEKFNKLYADKVANLKAQGAIA